PWVCLGSSGCSFLGCATERAGRRAKSRNSAPSRRAVTSSQVNATIPTWAGPPGLCQSDWPVLRRAPTMKKLLATLVLGGLGLAVGTPAGCQPYASQPVTPLAVAQDARTVPLAFNRPKPNLMILEDKSGSMADPVTPGGPSKITVLKQVMGNFLTNDP